MVGIGVLFILQAAKPDVGQLLAKMRAAYAAVKTATIQARCTQYAGKNQVQISSSIVFSAPASFRVESTGVPGLTSGKYLEVCNGKTIHIEGLPGGSMDVPYKLQEAVNQTPQVNLEVLCFWDWKRQLSTDKNGNMHFSTFTVRPESWSGKVWTVLEETASRSGLNVDYFVDPKTNLIWRTVEYDIGDRTPIMDASILKMRINAPVDRAIFRLAVDGRASSRKGEDHRSLMVKVVSDHFHAALY